MIQSVMTVPEVVECISIGEALVVCSHCMTQQCCCTLEMIAMGSHVTVQVATLGKSCITDLTLVRFLSSMGSVVLGEGGAIGKTLAAGTALVGSVSRMGPHVSGDGTAL